MVSVLMGLIVWFGRCTLNKYSQKRNTPRSSLQGLRKGPSEEILFKLRSEVIQARSRKEEHFMQKDSLWLEDTWNIGGIERNVDRT